MSLSTAAAPQKDEQKAADPALDNLIDQLLQAPVPGQQAAGNTAEKGNNASGGAEVEAKAEEASCAPPPAPRVLKLVKSVAPMSLTTPAPETYTKEIQTDAVDETPMVEEKPGSLSPRKRNQGEAEEVKVEAVEEGKVEEPVGKAPLPPVVDEAERQCIEESQGKQQICVRLLYGAK